MRKFKRLNRKGFTLIELLAVIVILAVVMGIAANSVLNSMNKARGGALLDSAQVIARGLDQRLMAVQVDGSSTINGTALNVGTSGISTISNTLLAEYGLKTDDYIGSTNATAIAITNNAAPTSSFIYYNATSGSFIVCLYATTTGKNDVAAYRKASKKLVTMENTKTISTSTTAVVAGCSDGAKTW